MQQHPEDDARVDERSGADVAEAVEVAAAGSHHEGVERPPSEADPGDSPVEQTTDDPAMTGGQVVGGPGTPGGPHPAPPTAPTPEAPVGGGAQSLPGARVSDRVAAEDD